jgi:hypothetical protein
MVSRHVSRVVSNLLNEGNVMGKEKEEKQAVEVTLSDTAKDKDGNVINEFNYYKWSLDREGLDKVLTRYDIKKLMGMVNSIEKTLKRNAAARPESAPSVVKDARDTLKVLEKDLKEEMEKELREVQAKYAGLVKAA